MAYSRPYRYCHGCPARLTGNAQKWCGSCRPKAKAPKASSAQRGYDHAHRKERAKWAAEVESGQGRCREPVCLMRSRWIPPGSAWDLAHAPGGGYHGPSHSKCNRTEGARRGGLAVAAKKRGRYRQAGVSYPVAAAWQSREW